MNTINYSISLYWADFGNRFSPVVEGDVKRDIRVDYSNALRKWQLNIVARVWTLDAKNAEQAIEAASEILIDKRPELFISEVWRSE